MKRAMKVLETASDIIESGSKPTAGSISQKMNMHESDVHRCLNYLEREKKVKTERKKIFNSEHRMVSVYR